MRGAHRSRTRVVAVITGFVVAAMVVPVSGAGATEHDALSMEALSARPDLVSGGDVLVAVDMPLDVAATDVTVTRNGDDVTAVFDADADVAQRLVGLVDGLVDGPNLLEASAPGVTGAQLQVVNHPITGPLISGPHQVPFICQTDAAGLGPPLDDDCSAPTQVEYHYRTTAGTFAPLPDPADAPADLAQTTTRAGETVDYVVRVESGVINRAVYRWAVLAEGGETGAGWTGNLVYSFGGGCGPGYHQGTQGSVLNHAALSRGFASASASLNTFGNSCNDVLSAETMMMVKERIIEELGAPPTWTMGQGGSGGAIQQILLAHNYPGLLDGIVPSATFQDAQLADPPDCRLLVNYFARPDVDHTSAEQAAIAGYHTFAGCNLWHLAFADIVNASLACSGVIPTELIYHPTDNPTGARCTVWDQMRNIYGVDAETGFGRRSYDNTGTQYGLEALHDENIDVDAFLDLNEAIGGYDGDGNIVGERSVANLGAVEATHETGRLALGGALSDVPILDVRGYTDMVGDLHTYVHSFVLKERLRESFGHADNMVMWRAGGGGTGAMNAGVLDLMADWLDGIAADDSGLTQADKVVANKPADAVDACWTSTGERIDDPAEIDGAGPCTQLYPPASTTRMAAGAPLAQPGIKCALAPIDLAGYPPMTPAQEARLHAVFPDGVCDYEQSLGATPWAGPWQRFGAPFEEPTTGAIAGRVVGPDNEALAGAVVRAYSPTDTWVWTRITTTGSDGTYEISDLAPDDYQVMFSGAVGSSLVTEWYQHSATRAGANPVSVTAGLVASQVDGKLAPGGSVAGTVHGPDGEPLHGVQVWAYADTDRWVGTAVTTTGADGTYSLEGIPQGSYRILFRVIDDSGLPNQWWEGVELRRDAPHLAVDWNQHVPGIDAQLGVVTPTFVEGDCWWDLPGSFPDDVTITCGTVDVPADHTDPTSSTISLAVAHLQGPGASSGAAPVLRLHGGPGGSSLGSPPTGTARLDVLADRDVILFDQRGAGNTVPNLNCPEKEVAIIDALAADAPFQEMLAPNRAAAVACSERLQAEGIDLDHYHTLASVADMESLRVAFGVEQWNLWGGSYGTRLGLAYARVHPERVRSLVIDSVYPPEEGSIERTMQLAPDALARLSAECADDAACDAAFGNLDDVLAAAVASFDDDPAVVTQTIELGGQQVERTFTLNGADVRAGMFAALYENDLIPLLPSILASLAAGDRSIIPAFIALGVPRLTGYSEGMQYSVECADNGSFFGDVDVVGELPHEHEDAMFLVTMAHAYCAVWDVAALGAEFNEQALPDVPTLVFAGTLDPVTPSDVSRAQAEAMPDARLVTVPRGGHGVARINDCTTSALHVFWVDPAAALPTCVDHIEAPAFVVP